MSQNPVKQIFAPQSPSRALSLTLRPLALMLGACFASVVLSGLGCAKSMDTELNPSIRADYEEKWSFLRETLEATATGQLESTEVEFIRKHISEIRDIIPLSGLVKPLTYSSAQPSAVALEGQPAIRVERAQAWVICKTVEAIGEGTLYLYATGQFDKSWSTKPNPSRSYSAAPGEAFDYDGRAPQYRWDIREIVTNPRGLDYRFSFNRPSGCFGPLVLVQMTGFSPRTLSEIARLHAALTEVEEELSEALVQAKAHSNYPLAHVMTKIRSKLSAAFELLP